MNRTDRLYAITEELRRAGPGGRTGAQLAARFEVSTRTVKRDLLALQDTGLPIAACPGPGGGYVLDLAATLPPVTFTEAQAAAVAVALAALPDGPFAPDGQAALRKVLDAMGPAGQDRVAELAGRIWVQPQGLPRSPASRVIEEALRDGVTVTLDYVDAAARATHRQVEPQAFAYTRGRWYLLAWCLDRDGPRWFRWDRIQRAVPTRLPAQRRDVLTTFGTPPPGAVPAAEPRVGPTGRAPTRPERFGRVRPDPTGARTKPTPPPGRVDTQRDR
jgi:predicted DNA-binding transcriptional regulator YafY